MISGGTKGWQEVDLVEVIKGDSSDSSTHTGGQGLAGIPHKVRNTEETPQSLWILRHLKVPVGKCPHVTTPYHNPGPNPDSQSYLCPQATNPWALAVLQ